MSSKPLKALTTKATTTTTTTTIKMGCCFSKPRGIPPARGTAPRAAAAAPGAAATTTAAAPAPTPARAPGPATQQPAASESSAPRNSMTAFLRRPEPQPIQYNKSHPLYQAIMEWDGRDMCPGWTLNRVYDTDGVWRDYYKPPLGELGRLTEMARMDRTRSVREAGARGA
jgi:hypothetical protein